MISCPVCLREEISNNPMYVSPKLILCKTCKTLEQIQEDIKMLFQQVDKLKRAK